MSLRVYLSGEIHTNWRELITKKTNEMGLDVRFQHPVLDHELSDNCGSILMGTEEKKFWHDHKGAKLNALRTQNAIKNADIMVVRFGEKYKQWNAAFEAGYAAALGTPLIVIHSEEHQHALKEVDAAALVVLDDPEKVVNALNYILEGKL
jgi:YtoQ family protein